MLKLLTCKTFLSQLLRFAGVSAFAAALVTPAVAADKMTLRLDYLPQGYHAPLFYGVEQGFYRDEGIDLEIVDGTGSNPSLQSVAAGNDQIVLANLGTMVQSTTQGMPVIAIGGLIQRLPDAIIALKGSGITQPKHMEGRTMSIPPSSAIFKIVPAFAAAAGVDWSKVRMVQMTSGATHTALLQGQVDFTSGWAFTQGVAIRRQKPIEEPILISDYGVNMLGAGFVVRTDFADNNANLLKRFMTATARSYKVGIANQEASIDAIMAARPQLDAGAMLEMLGQLEPYLHTDRSQGQPFGWMASEDWEQTVDMLQKYFDMNEEIDIDAVYTNKFVVTP